MHTLDYEWDPSKAVANLKKHGVDFADAVPVFGDEFAVSLEDLNAGERRFVIIGADSDGQILVVVYTWRGERIRLISARKATPREARYRRAR